jgi:hypothetical protein
MLAWVKQLQSLICGLDWTVSKLRPRVFGERLDVSVQQHSQISVLAALEMAEKWVALSNLG